jgi:hypothetical protein
LIFAPSLFRVENVKSLHSKLQLARSRARGFRNFDYLPTIAYWIAGGLKPESGGVVRAFGPDDNCGLF